MGPSSCGVPFAYTSSTRPRAAGRCQLDQRWYRDPGAPCGFAFNLSNAVAVTSAPSSARTHCPTLASHAPERRGIPSIALRRSSAPRCV